MGCFSQVSSLVREPGKPERRGICCSLGSALSQPQLQRGREGRAGDGPCQAGVRHSQSPGLGALGRGDLCCSLKSCSQALCPQEPVVSEPWQCHSSSPEL